jgi:pentatricopeptide repeat protein
VLHTRDAVRNQPRPCPVRGLLPQGPHNVLGDIRGPTFWYTEALVRAGRVAEAVLVFEKMLTYGNLLGLYAEQIGATGEQLGNFPQAFTHLALISAAVNLDRQLSGHSLAWS